MLKIFTHSNIDASEIDIMSAEITPVVWRNRDIHYDGSDDEHTSKILLHNAFTSGLFKDMLYREIFGILI